MAFEKSFIDDVFVDLLINSCRKQELKMEAVKTIKIPKRGKVKIKEMKNDHA